MRPSVKYTPEQIEAIRTRYPHERTDNIARSIGLTTDQVYKRAAALGLCKTPEYLASPEACRLSGKNQNSVACRFPKGHVPANKGTRFPGWAAGRMAETQFKKGQRPHTWRPIGAERLSKEGYLQVKLRETGVSRHDYVPVHHLVWELHHGSIPDGHRITFKDGDKTHITIDNLEAVSIADMMRRNTIHNLPEELKEVLQLQGNLNRRITCHERRKRTQKTSV